MSAPTHMTAEQILAAMRRGGERVSKATVYNTLKVLAQRGLVRQIHLDPERSVYDSTRTPHHHFHDLETGELRDIDPNDIAFSRFPTLPEGMEAEAVEVVIRLRKKRIAGSACQDAAAVRLGPCGQSVYDAERARLRAGSFSARSPESVYFGPLAGVAQLVEQRIRNARVGSSSLFSGTIRSTTPRFTQHSTGRSRWRGVRSCMGRRSRGS